jgi:hypothetical protein
MREKISRKGTEATPLDTLEDRFLERLFQKRKTKQPLMVQYSNPQ